MARLEQPAVDATRVGGFKRGMTDTLLFRPSRRAFVGGALAMGLLPRSGIAVPISGLFAGTYAQEGGAGLVSLAADQGGWTAGAAHPAIRNASFGVVSRRHGLRYLLDEQQKGMMGVYDASLRQVAVWSTMGADPCHIALSQDGKLLAAANYSSGSVALWTLNPATGLPTDRPAMAQHQGSGPDAKRQADPHAHWVGFDRTGDILHSVDLGADAVFSHHIDRAAGRIAQTSIAYRAAAGSGPRHLARHPRLPIAYLVAELANTVTVLRAETDGAFAKRAEVSTLPAGFNGASYAAHIAVNAAGTRLYVSNRGHDSIAVFAIGAAGDLSLLQLVGCGGHWPRFFLLLEDRNAMLVANERSGGIARLPLERDGRLRAAVGTTPVPGVVFLTE